MLGSVLLYEDDCLLRGLVTKALRDAGHDVVICRSLHEVQRAAAADPTALALVDAWGTTFYRLDEGQRPHIRQFAQRVPTVMMTANIWAHPAKAKELGLLAVVGMPLELEQLVETVSEQVVRLLERSQAAQERSHQVTRASSRRRTRSSICTVPKYRRTAARAGLTPPPA
jgi:DNA-binding NtrC family response regulator